MLTVILYSNKLIINMQIIFIITILPIILWSNALRVRYDGYQVFRSVPRNVKQLQSLNDLQVQNDSYSFWSPINLNYSVDVMIPPNHRVDFERTLNSLDLSTTLMIEDVQGIINKDVSLNYTDKEKFDWKKYRTLDQINRWLKSLTIKHPRIVTLLRGGRSHQGRSITGVRISYKAGNKAVYIEGGIHAREWISPATATYLINQLLNSDDVIVRNIAESRDWYIFPVINPDGYVYTMTTDRLWRKNRRRITALCIGVDLNRNWDYKWMHGGASRDPCNILYAGPGPFSEIETKSLSKFVNKISPILEGHITLHSYSQQLLIPFGHDGREVPANIDQLLRIGKNAAKALAQRYGTQYTVGTIFDVSGVGSGSSDDWALGTYRHLKFVYTYELRDTGRYGFLLPPAQIIPTGEETLDSIMSIILQFQNEEVATER